MIHVDSRAREGVDPVKAFREAVRHRWRCDTKSPYNAADLEKTDLMRVFYENLRGEMQGEVYGGSKEPQASVADGYKGASR